ncbi:MAG: hypothetical protein AAF490_33030 [Chloroflexota bacterium]
MPKILHLAEVRTWRSVMLLPTSHIALNWDWFTFELRTADLIVLHQAVDQQLTHSQLEAFFYRVSLTSVNLEENHLVISADDLVELHQLLAEAIKMLPRRVVRWIDTKVAIVPLDSQCFIPSSQFSKS